jgi:hypothetical protein
LTNQSFVTSSLDEGLDLIIKLLTMSRRKFTLSGVEVQSRRFYVSMNLDCARFDNSAAACAERRPRTRFDYSRSFVTSSAVETLLCLNESRLKPVLSVDEGLDLKIKLLSLSRQKFILSGIEVQSRRLVKLFFYIFKIRSVFMMRCISTF